MTMPISTRLAPSLATLATALLSLAAPTTATAQGRSNLTKPALNYSAKAKTCMSQARFADEVSAKLGFVPWDDQAPYAVRIRVIQDADGGEFTGTLQYDGGESKVISGDTCKVVTDGLVSAVAVLLDQPGGGSVQGTGQTMVDNDGDRRLRRLERPTSLPVAVRFVAAGDVKLTVAAAQRSTTIAMGNYGQDFVEYGESCAMPCKLPLATGSQKLLLRNETTGFASHGSVTIAGNEEVVATYVDRSATRNSKRKRGTIGFIAGTLATGIIWSMSTSSDTDLIGWTLIAPLGGALVGGIAASGGGPTNDDIQLSVRNP